MTPSQKRASIFGQQSEWLRSRTCYITNFTPNHFERIADTNIFGRGFDANWFLDRIDRSAKIYSYIEKSRLFIGSQEVMIGKDFDLV